MSKEIDLKKFNKEFENKDKDRIKYREKVKFTNYKHSQFSSLDENIHKMRISFDFITIKISRAENPFPIILDNEDLTLGTIYLLFFLGGLNLILSGLMKN